ncbi:hypothetical protein Tcan_12465 [Toxocara canis]|uniref:Uncharacterized protein n=1 Tax=Toxocara canis TaxID=6265 RepID=A0A0B2V7R9_TOXCA|nr:hypothetical protein Tcan_12465 [Toxocara canis]
MACSTDTQPLRSLKELWEWERSKANGRLVGKPLSNYTQRAQRKWLSDNALLKAVYRAALVVYGRFCVFLTSVRHYSNDERVP